MKTDNLNNGQKSYISAVVRKSGGRLSEEASFAIAAKLDVPVGVITEYAISKHWLGQDESTAKLAQKLHLQKEELSTLRKQQKASITHDAYLDMVKEQIHRVCPAMPPLPRAPMQVREGSDIQTESLVMHVSDEHADQIVHPDSVNGLENYNFQVALRRAENYVSSVLKFTQKTLKNYKFPTLWMLCYGDHVNGAIHKGTERSAYRNDFANAIAVGQMHALMVRDLSPYFERVICVYVPGNHGRQSTEKDYDNALRNLDYLVAETNSAYCRDIPNVEFLVPNAHSVNVDIEGHTFNISHGDDITGSSGIPWYGIERRNRRLQAVHGYHGKNIRYKVMGHWHNAINLSDPVGETIVNGSWKATDAYLYNKFGGFNEPVQWLHGVNQSRGITWRLPIHLRSPDDSKGPQRYKVSLLSNHGN